MSSDTPDLLGHAVASAARLADDTDRLRNHCLWEARTILSRLRLSDFTTAELLGVLAVVAPIHSRLLPQGVPVGVHDVEHRRLHAV